MKIEIEIQNCQECPYSWSHTSSASGMSWVCDKLQDNVGAGDIIRGDCPLKGKSGE